MKAFSFSCDIHTSSRGDVRHDQKLIRIEPVIQPSIMPIRAPLPLTRTRIFQTKVYTAAVSISYKNHPPPPFRASCAPVVLSCPLEETTTALLLSHRLTLLLHNLADLHRRIEELGRAAIQADRLALVELRLPVVGRNALLLASLLESAPTISIRLHMSLISQHLEAPPRRNDRAVVAHWGDKRTGCRYRPSCASRPRRQRSSAPR